MRLRLTAITAIVLIEILWLLGVATPATDAPGYEAYTVSAQGESITSIAAEYDIPAELVAQANNISVTTPLRQGQVLLIPTQIQLAPQTAMYAGADFSVGQERRPLSPNQVEGTIATVTAKRAEVRSAPEGGRVLWNKLTRGTELLVLNQTDTFYGVLMSDGAIGWVPRVAVQLSDTRLVVDRPTVEAPATNAPGRQDLVDTAFLYIGTPYKYGGRLPETVDCSLLVQTVFKRHGISLPRTAAQQFQVGQPVAVEDLVPGDRLYFYDPDMKRIGHTGLYIGNGRFIHASSNRGQVAVDMLSSNPYAKRFAGARR